MDLTCEMREKETDCDFSETNGNNNERGIFLDGGVDGRVGVEYRDIMRDF